MKNGVHSFDSSQLFATCRSMRIICSMSSRFFQRMAVFTLYFGICLFGLILRGYYRVPMSCIVQEVLDKEENTVKSSIADRIECKCHYTNFFWHLPFMDNGNRTIFNQTSDINVDDENEYYRTGLVKH
jgi:hypothetical protein